MALREDVARAIGRDVLLDPLDVEPSEWLDAADAALAVMAAEHSRRIEVALGRINEVRVRLGSPTCARPVGDLTMAELRTSLLAAMTELQGMLPAERASEWDVKRSRQP